MSTGKDRFGDAWVVDREHHEAAPKLVHLLVHREDDEAAHAYTPTQARELAKALNDLADELDPPEHIVDTMLKQGRKAGEEEQGRHRGELAGDPRFAPHHLGCPSIESGQECECKPVELDPDGAAQEVGS